MTFLSSLLKKRVVRGIRLGSSKSTIRVLKPSEIYAGLDEHVVGQSAVKVAISVGKNTTDISV
jgi:ATP-dependent protease Clp ATPase subunit